MSQNSKDEKRNEQRLNIALDVEISAETEENIPAKTRDMSPSGLFIEIEKDLLLPVGSEIYVKLNENLGEGEAPLVKAQIVRVDEDGIGIRFIDTEEKSS